MEKETQRRTLEKLLQKKNVMTDAALDEEADSLQLELLLIRRLRQSVIVSTE